MIPQEEQLLNSLVERVNQTQLQEKDPEAEALLNRQLGSNPDALYILAQTVLVQNIALDQAKAQIAQLQQATRPAHSTSFLGSLFSHPTSQPAPAAAPVPAPVATPAYQPVNLPPQSPFPPQYAQPQWIPAAQPSFLRGAMQTAAGVAAGALAFEGVEAVLHGLGGFGHPGYGFGGGFAPGFGGGYDRPVEETIVNNNYYDGQQGGEPERREFHESADTGNAQLSDVSYGGNDQTNFDGQANFNDSDQSGSLDDSSLNDSGNFDSGGFDNSGSFDDGGGFGGDGGSDLL